MKNIHARQFPLFTLLLTLCSMSTQALSQDQAVLTPRQRMQLIDRSGQTPSISKTNDLAPTVPYVTINYPGSTSTIAYAVNNSGDIVGGYVVNGQGYGFLYSGGKFRSLNPPGGTAADASGINDEGDIVGGYEPNGTTKEYSFLLKAGVYSNIIYPGATNTFANTINNQGDIVGNYDDRSNTQHGFLYSGGVYTDIDPPGSVHTLVGGNNSLGEIVGIYCVSPCTTFQAFTYLDGTYSNLSLPSLVELSGVNSEGDIVGNWEPSSGVGEDFFYNATTQAFVPFDIDGSTDTSALGINDNCAMVGFYLNSTTSDFNGYYVHSSSCH
jgi:probable HAF family extracellular repeat protein